jgi:hypothetical protein
LQIWVRFIFSELDPDPDSHKGKKLDPDPQISQNPGPLGAENGSGEAVDAHNMGLVAQNGALEGL